MWAQLKHKCNVFYFDKTLNGNDARSLAQWTAALGADRTMPLEDPKVATSSSIMESLL